MGWITSGRGTTGAAVAALALVAGFIGWHLWKHQSVLSACQEEILRYDGPLGRGEPAVSVRVYACHDSSVGLTGEDVRQNLIKITDESGEQVFMWPSPFLSREAWVEDVDADGRKELVFLGDPWDYRVVSFREASYQFRAADHLDTAGLIRRAADVTGDSRLEFFALRSFPDDFMPGSDVKTLTLPKVFRWTADLGFVDVSDQISIYYQQEVIPRLRQRLEVEADPARRAVLNAALEYVAKLVASSPTE